MAKKPKVYENYPGWIVLVIVLVNLSLYLSGLFLVYLIGPGWALLYLVYILFLEYYVFREGCCCCYYYGKLCAFGRGRIAPRIVKKEDPKRFCKKEVNMKKMLPHFLLNIVPLAAGIIVLLRGFDFLILGITAWPIILMIFGNPIIYGKLSCPHCKQGDICCPALEFFGKSGKKKK